MSLIKSKQSGFWQVFEFLKFALIAIVIVLPIRMWVAQPFIVSGESMDPTFKDGNYLIVDEISYATREPQKNEVIIFRYPKDPSKYFIKRIIGLPGETVEVAGTQIILKEDEYYVLGDNRDRSLDSRVWGAVSKKNIIGRAYVRLLPITNINYLPGSNEGIMN